MNALDIAGLTVFLTSFLALNLYGGDFLYLPIWKKLAIALPIVTFLVFWIVYAHVMK